MIAGELGELSSELIAQRAPFVEATVVRAQHPTSAQAGDAAIVLADGTINGFVGGQCAETSVRLQALRALETGEATLLRILPSEGDAGQSDEPGSITVVNPCLSGGALEIFLEPRLPSPVIRVVGAGPIAAALAELAAGVGLDLATDADGALPNGSEELAVIVASHGHDEEPALTAALEGAVPYVALVASTKRGEAVRDSLDLPAELRERLRTPAGLAIGAVTPGEIAVSILAEVVAVRRGRTPEPAAASPSPDVAIDPVCGMEVVVSPASVHLDLDGTRHYFCREHCRDEFAAARADAGR